MNLRDFLNSQINGNTLRAINPVKVLGLDRIPAFNPLAVRDKLQEASVPELNFGSYKKLIDDDMYSQILELAEPLRGLKVAMLNATPFGGGVAEIFKSMIPLMRSLDIDVRWYVMSANDEFFGVTKAFHNALQGAELELTPRIKEVYLDQNQHTAKLMKQVEADIWEIHDPQPAAVSEFIDLKNSIWRCHIDTSTPNQEVWRFLRPFISKYNELIFTMPDYVHGQLKNQNLNFFTPTIDPLSIKNVLLSRDFASALLSAFGIDTNRPLITQISRFDPWKDPKGVIDVYRLVKQEVPSVQLALVGSMAHDDPQGLEIYREVEAYAKGDPNIRLYTNLLGVGEIEVNAFQSYSDVVLQKSIREGFGLTVTEAMWKRTPVVASAAGGITLQIKNGQDGFLVTSIEECAQRTLQLLKDDELRQRLGEAAQEQVRKNFLHPRLILDHLKLYHKLIKPAAAKLPTEANPV